MGDFTDEACTRRAAAILSQAKQPIPEISAYIGQTVTIVDAGLEVSGDHIIGFVTFDLGGGNTVGVELGKLYEVQEYGVAGYSLEDMFPEEELAEMAIKALKDPENPFLLDETDREFIRDDVREYLGEQYIDDED